MAISASSKGAMASPNITPLIDVLLVLMIIFMIITPIVQTGFYTQVPPKAKPTKQQGPTTAIVLQMSANGAMAINHTPVSMQQLGDRLFTIYSTRADKVLFIDADDKVHYDRVVKALDLAKGRGQVETIGFVVN